MDTFKDRLAFLWKDEARQAKIAADIDMRLRIAERKRQKTQYKSSQNQPSIFTITSHFHSLQQNLKHTQIKHNSV